MGVYLDYVYNLNCSLLSFIGKIISMFFCHSYKGKKILLLFASLMEQALSICGVFLQEEFAPKANTESCRTDLLKVCPF